MRGWQKKHMRLIFLKFILQRGSGWKLFPVVICTVAPQLNSPAPPPPLDINAQQKFGTKDGGGNKSQMDTVGVRISVWEFCQTPSWNQWKKKRETSLSSEFPFSQKSRTCIFLFSWYSFTSDFQGKVKLETDHLKLPAFAFNMARPLGLALCVRGGLSPLSFPFLYFTLL